MKILYASDMHSDFKNLKFYTDFAKENKPDITVVSGDLIEFGYQNENDIAEHFQLLGPMAKLTEELLKRKNKLHLISSPAELLNAVPIIAVQIAESQAYPQELKELAQQYLANIDKAIEIMEMQYSLIKDLFSGLENAVALPGNYDPDLENTPLKEHNIHNKIVQTDNFTIAGYGGAGSPHGAPIGSIAVPLELAVAFNEVISEEGVMSCPYQFLKETRPDIVIAHAPPFGHLDAMQLEEGKTVHVGSPGFHKYLTEDDKVELFLCGHNHEDAGVCKVRNAQRFVAVVNGGSLKKEEKGRFFEIEIDDATKKFIAASQYSILPSGELLLEVRYLRTEDNIITPLVVNRLL